MVVPGGRAPTEDTGVFLGADGRGRGVVRVPKQRASDVGRRRRGGRGERGKGSRLLLLLLLLLGARGRTRLRAERGGELGRCWGGQGDRLLLLLLLLVEPVLDRLAVVALGCVGGRQLCAEVRVHGERVWGVGEIKEVIERGELVEDRGEFGLRFEGFFLVSTYARKKRLKGGAHHREVDGRQPRVPHRSHLPHPQGRELRFAERMQLAQPDGGPFEDCNGLRACVRGAGLEVVVDGVGHWYFFLSIVGSDGGRDGRG